MYKKCRYLRQRTKKGELYYYCAKQRKIAVYDCYRGCLDKEYKLPKQKEPKTTIKKSSIRVKPKKYQVSEKTYNEVFKRCSGKCALCLTEIDLHLHHIKGRGRYLTDDPDNCILLCNKCHLETVHKNNKFWRPLLLKIVDRQKENEFWYKEDN